MQMHFGDAQEQASALAGWNQDYLQIGAGRFRGELQLARAPGLRLFVERLQQPVWQSGALPHGVLALGVPLQAAGAGIFCGTPCGADSLHVFSGTDGFEFRSSPAHAMLGVEMSIDGGGPEALPARPGAWQMPPALAAHVRQQLLTLFESARDRPEVFTQAPVREAAADLVHQSLSVAGATPPAAPCTHWKLVQRACALVGARPEQVFTVASLCQALGVSRRTLQAGFQQVLGIGPLAYLKAVRLRLARGALRAGRCVSDAATAHGFWHFGHFARDYAAMFGERPSETLRRHGRGGPARC